jgi:hypothetical protein
MSLGLRILMINIDHFERYRAGEAQKYGIVKLTPLEAITRLKGGRGVLCSALMRPWPGL